MSAAITASLIKELRDRTGVGMSKCKEALSECGGDMEKAIDHLRKKGIKNLQQFEKHIKAVEDDFWQNRFRVYNKWKQKSISRYQRRGYLDMFTGFRCSGFLDRNQITNYPIQGTAFHCLLWTLIELDQILHEEDFESMIIGQIHDSMLIDVVPEELDDIINMIKYIVEKRLVKHYDWISVPMEIEAEITPIDGSWYEKEELDLAA